MLENEIIRILKKKKNFIFIYLSRIEFNLSLEFN